MGGFDSGSFDTGAFDESAFDFGSDVTAPTLSSATINAAGNAITFAFNESVSIGAGGNGGFALSLSGGACTATYSSGDGTSSLTYSLSRTVGEDETGTFAYTQPGDGIEDAEGNDLATIASQAVVNNSTQDLTAPTLSSAAVASDGNSITLSFSEAVTFGAGGNGGFALTASGGASTMTYSSGDGSNQLVYTLSRTIAVGETVTLAYTQPTNGVEDTAGNDLATFSGQSVTVGSALAHKDATLAHNNTSLRHKNTSLRHNRLTLVHNG